MDLHDTAASARDIENTTDSNSRLQLSAASSSLSQSERACDQRHIRAAGTRWGAAEFVALSRFTIAHLTDEVKQAFQQRPHFVENATGFVRMEVLSPCDAPDEIWLITYWENEASYQTWHRSHLYQESHRGIPKGLRLVPNSVSIRFFNHVAS
jgi:heme-degrading monooxygenase HmoA